MTERITTYRHDGLDFDVRDTGPLDGTPAVLLHGFPQRNTMWDPVAPLLHEHGIRTLAPDQRGYSPGARPPRRRDYRSAHLAGDVEALVAEVGVPVHLVGHDWGAAVAWLVAARRPELVRSLTAVSVPHPMAFLRAMATSSQGVRSWYMYLFQLPGVAERLAAQPGGRFDRNLRNTGMTGAEVARFRREIVEYGALPGGLGVVPRHAAARPRARGHAGHGAHDPGVERPGHRGRPPRGRPDRRLRRRAVPPRGPGGGQPLDPDPGARAAGRGDPPPDRGTVTGRPVRSRAATEERTGSRRDRERPPAPEPLPHPVVDNHCHLDIADGEEWFSVDDALAAAAAVNVTRIVQIGCDLPGARWAVEAARSYDALVAGVALHPNEAPRLAATGSLDEALVEIEALARSHPKVRAVGETGLDHFRTGEDGRAAQVESFRRHIDLAKRLDKTLVIHDRDAHDEVLAVLDEEGAPERWVMHCFSGDADVARRCLDRGAHLSFAGTVTFKNAQPLRDALAITPRDRVLVETDAPYLTPQPYRGRPNASYLVPHTMRAMAQVRGDDLATLCEAVDANTETAFGGAW